MLRTIGLFVLAFCISPVFAQNNFTVVYAKEGDTVASIANEYKVDPVEVAKMNGLLTNTKLRVGFKLFLPIVPPPCKMKLEDSPSIRGIRLGMPRGEFVAMLRPETLVVFESSGYAPDYYFRDRESIAGIQSVRAHFFEDKLLSFRVDYPDDVQWGPREFAEVVRERLDLPQADWKISSFGYLMDCDEFTLNVRQGAIDLENTKALKDKAAAERAEQERKKATFKP